MTATNTTIIPAEGNAMWCHYGRQAEPQSGTITYDPSDGTLRAGYNPEVGNAVPIDIWEGKRLRWYTPPLTDEGANALLADIARVIDAGEIHTGTIDALINRADDYGPINWASADDWLYEIKGEIQARLAAGETIEALADEYDGTGRFDDEPILLNLMTTLEVWADETRGGA